MRHFQCRACDHVGPPDWFVDPSLLDDWLFDAQGQARPFDDVWIDLKRARMMTLCVEQEGLEFAIVDLYCAAYRWHLARTNPTLTPEARHRLSQIAAVAEAVATEEALRR